MALETIYVDDSNFPLSNILKYMGMYNLWGKVNCICNEESEIRGAFSLNFSTCLFNCSAVQNSKILSKVLYTFGSKAISRLYCPKFNLYYEDAIKVFRYKLELNKDTEGYVLELNEDNSQILDPRLYARSSSHKLMCKFKMGDLQQDVANLLTYLRISCKGKNVFITHDKGENLVVSLEGDKLYSDVYKSPTFIVLLNKCIIGYKQQTGNDLDNIVLIGEYTCKSDKDSYCLERQEKTEEGLLTTLACYLGGKGKR